MRAPTTTTCRETGEILLKGALDYAANLSAGWGDSLTGDGLISSLTGYSLTQTFRRMVGFDEVVDSSSGEYRVGTEIAAAQMFLMVDEAGGTAAAAEDSVTLWRAVKPEELEDIEKTGILQSVGPAESKYFSTTAEGAASYAKQAVAAFRDPPYTLVKTTVPRSLLRAEYFAEVDRGVPAVALPNSALEELIPEILNSFPIP